MPETNTGANTSLSDRVRSLRLGDKAEGRSSRRGVLPWVFVAVLLLTTVAFGYRAYRVDTSLRDAVDRDLDSASKPKPGPYQPSPTDEKPDTTAPGEVVLQSKGYVVPVSLIQVSPKVGGQLIKITPGFMEGAIFKEGDILAEIEDTDYKADFEQMKFAYDTARERHDEILRSMPLEIKQAEADLEEARQTATQQRLELERNRKLAMSSAGTPREYEQAQFAYTATQARIRKLEATLKLIRDGRKEARERAAQFEMRQAQAMMEKAKWRLDNTKIRAPLTGTVLTKKAEKGNIVNPSAFSSGISASLCEMANLRELEIDLSIQERDIAQVIPGQPCWVMPEAYQTDREFLKRHPKGYEAFVSRLMPTADRAKGAIPVRVKIKDISEEEAGKYLRPEMSALVSFLKPPTRPKQ